ncbi:MAG: esterase [Pseudomonadota bacterium]|nr:esterase [Pseudomonadota bacterium]
MHDGLILQEGGAAGGRLCLLFHGVGARPEAMAGVGHALAERDPALTVVSVQAPQRSDVGFGWQWFSVRGVDEANRPARVAAAMPAFVECVRHWQGRCQAAPADTTLVGFSQGALMALEATQVAAGLAAHVVSLGGRFARPPQRAPLDTVVHVLHGEDDPVMDCARAVAACEQLQMLGGQVTLDLFPGLGHDIDARVIARLLERLPDPAA